MLSLLWSSPLGHAFQTQDIWLSVRRSRLSISGADGYAGHTSSRHTHRLQTAAASSSGPSKAQVKEHAMLHLVSLHTEQAQGR